MMKPSLWASGLPAAIFVVMATLYRSSIRWASVCGETPSFRKCAAHVCTHDVRHFPTLPGAESIETRLAVPTVCRLGGAGAELKNRYWPTYELTPIGRVARPELLGRRLRTMMG